MKIKSRVLYGTLAVFFALCVTACAQGGVNNHAGGSGSGFTSASVDGNEPEKADTVAVVKISAVGDCTLGMDVNAAYATSFNAKYEEAGSPAYFFQNVSGILGSDDLTIANLEGTLTEATARQDKTFAFKGKPEYTQILTDGSVEAVNLANNHSHDYGDQSYQDTITNVTNAGIINFGYERTAVVEVNGVKVGLTGTYCLRGKEEALQSLAQAIGDVKAQGAEIIVSSFHWGVEREHVPNADQREIAHAAVDQGADLVLGHHPHVLQGIEEYKGRRIVYSLGNFCFGGNKNPADKNTMIYQQTFTVKNGKLQDGIDAQVIPCSISSVDYINNYQPTPLTGDRRAAVEQLIQEYSQRIGG